MYDVKKAPNKKVIFKTGEDIKEIQKISEEESFEINSSQEMQSYKINIKISSLEKNDDLTKSPLKLSS